MASASELQLYFSVTYWSVKYWSVKKKEDLKKKCRKACYSENNIVQQYPAFFANSLDQDWNVKAYLSNSGWLHFLSAMQQGPIITKTNSLTSLVLSCWRFYDLVYLNLRNNWFLTSSIRIMWFIRRWPSDTLAVSNSKKQQLSVWKWDLLIILGHFFFKWLILIYKYWGR